MWILVSVSLKTWKVSFVGQCSWILINTPCPQRRGRWKTIERPHHLTESLSGLSVSIPLSPRSSMIPQWFFQGTLRSPLSLSNFELIRNSLVSEGSRHSMNAQRSLNERSTVSPVSQQMHFWWTLLVIQWSPLVAAAGLSESTVDRTMSTQWTLNGCMLVSQRMLSDHQGHSDRGLCIKSPWNLLKLNFRSLNECSRFSWSIFTETTFSVSWRLLRDLANFWSLNCCIMASVLWKGAQTFPQGYIVYATVTLHVRATLGVGRGYLLAVKGSPWQLRGLRLLLRVYVALTGRLWRTPRNSNIIPAVMQTP